jgi:hypothetical protein
LLKVRDHSSFFPLRVLEQARQLDGKRCFHVFPPARARAGPRASRRPQATEAFPRACASRGLQGASRPASRPFPRACASRGSAYVTSCCWCTPEPSPQITPKMSQKTLC